jgi:tRNA threonylcarbamoyl adenosine modification protein YeaZ
MPEPLVLGLDTAMVVTVGLARGLTPLGGATVADRMAHVEQLTPMVARVCRDAGVRIDQLELIVVGLGPGPFTGLRVGVVTARILAEVTGAALHGVCSLDVLAAQYAGVPGRPPPGDFVVASDARRREVYWACYASDGTRIDGPFVSAPTAVPRLPTVGPAVEVYPEALAAVASGPRVLDPAVLAGRGPVLPSAGSQPLYLRRPDAAEPGRRKPVLRPVGPRVRPAVRTQFKGS